MSHLKQRCFDDLERLKPRARDQTTPNDIPHLRVPYTKHPESI